MWVMLTRQLSRLVSNFKAFDTKRVEREKVLAAMLMILGIAGCNPPGFVPKPPQGHSNLSNNIFSLAKVARGSHKLN